MSQVPVNLPPLPSPKIVDRLPVARLYCSTCQKITDLHVGVTKDRCPKGWACSRCGSFSTTWLNSYKPIESQNCLHVADECEVVREERPDSE
jgi:hypothetical protein